MADYHSEEEQVEALKKWWQENGKAVLTGLAVGVALLFGGRAWFDYQSTRAQNASVRFEALSNAVQAGSLDVANQQLEELTKDFSGTPYAALGQLAVAKAKADAKDWEGAASHLQWVIDNGGVANLEHVARLRLARVRLAEGKSEQALELLARATEGDFAATAAEVRGDVYYQQGNLEQARAAYEEALKGEHWDPEKRRLIQMKLDDLGVGVAETKTAQ